MDKSAAARKAWKTKRNNGFDGIKRGVESPLYKKSKISYSGVHVWLIRNYGKAIRCEDCGVIGAKKYEWANISKEYRRDISDYKQLCTSCHHKFDDIYNKRPIDMYKRGWETRRK